MTRVELIYAGPTPWDAEDRVVGNHSLPLTEDAAEALHSLADRMSHPPAQSQTAPQADSSQAPPLTPTAIYCFRGNEACRQAADIFAKKFLLRVRDNAYLDEVGVGLWQGLTRADVRRRFPTTFEQWVAQPRSVTPPEGEPLDEAVARLRGALKKIVRRNRGACPLLVLRPMAMRIAAALLRPEPPQALAAHLHEVRANETIVLQNDVLEDPQWNRT